jgi:drug/metabolite transporter (DMT)-like permease
MIMISVYTAIKGLPPVYVALSSNFSPLITALLSFLLLKVAITKLDIQILIISFIGVGVLISGTPD